MQSSDMKNMVVLKNLPSNMVEEAIIIFKETQKAKQKELIDKGKEISSVEIQPKSKEYILKEKIEHAKLLLAGTTESIQSISDNLAFSNRSYFYTCFQKKTGVSPTEYRKLHKK